MVKLINNEISTHINWTDNITTGRAPVLQSPDGTVVTYCRFGIGASPKYLTLRCIGFSDVRVYDGSWAEWGVILMLRKGSNI